MQNALVQSVIINAMPHLRQNKNGLANSYIEGALSLVIDYRILSILLDREKF